MIINKNAGFRQRLKNRGKVSQQTHLPKAAHLATSRPVGPGINIEKRATIMLFIPNAVIISKNPPISS
jgi:hypothetical protein